MRTPTRNLKVESAGDLEQVLSFTDFRREPLFVIPLISKQNPSRPLSREQDVLVVERDNMHVLTFLPIYGRDEGRYEPLELDVEKPGGIAYVLNTEHPDVWLLLTLEGNDFIKRRLSPALFQQRRAIPEFTLTNAEIHDLLAAVHEDGPWVEVLSKHAVLRPRGHGGKTVDYDPQDYGLVFEMADRKAALIDRIRVACDGSSFEFMIFREGSVRLLSGHWSYFERFLKAPLLSKISSRLEFVSDRGRKSFQELGRPLEIRFDSAMFSQPHRNALLVEALQSSGHASVAVMHSNPYLHASTVDLVDGSGIDVFITSDDTVLLMPGYRATDGALLRLVAAITDRIADGRISESPQACRMSLSDLAGVD